jgi:CRP/FNR family transcriptional regulator
MREGSNPLLSPIEILARCPLFAELATDDLAALAQFAVRRRYRAGESLFLAGEQPEGLHVVVSGAIRIYILSPQSGRELVLTVEHPFNAVAELASFDGGAYPANAEAMEKTQTLFIEQLRLEQTLRQRPEISLHLLRTLGRRLRRLVGVIEQLSFQEVVHRLAGYLLTRAAAGVPFELETNAQIAAQLGTVPELVSRNLSRLHQAGSIRLHGRTVCKVDFGALSELSQAAGR